jgi:peptidoglycan/xylan/chitin deacetylase (PgdA/CDA1 family)
MAFACLMYHSLSDGRFPDASYPKYTTTRKKFGEHLRALRGAGYRFAAVRDINKLLLLRKPVPVDTCVLTFDDGHKSSLDLAEEMLAVDATATFFVTRGYCETRDDFLKAGDICHLARAGFDFGAHGVSHRSLSHLPREEMRKELSDSKCWLEGVLSRPVHSMSLPAGQGDDAVYRAAHELGYTIVANSHEALSRIDRAPARLSRFVVLSNHTAKTVCQIASGSSAYILKRRLRAAMIYLPKRILGTYNKTRG